MHNKREKNRNWGFGGQNHLYSTNSCSFLQNVVLLGDWTLQTFYWKLKSPPSILYNTWQNKIILATFKFWFYSLTIQCRVFRENCNSNLSTTQSCNFTGCTLRGWYIPAFTLSFTSIQTFDSETSLVQHFHRPPLYRAQMQRAIVQSSTSLYRILWRRWTRYKFNSTSIYQFLDH